MWPYDDNDPKRSLGTRDRQILLKNADYKCQNCHKVVDYSSMQVGHKKAWSRGGRTTMKNSVCLCYECNKLQGRDSWEKFQKKQGREDPDFKIKQIKEILENLSIKQLKSLAENHHIKIRGRIDEDSYDSSRKAPTKKLYVTKLFKILSLEEINSIPKEEPKLKKKRRKRDDYWF